MTVDDHGTQRTIRFRPAGDTTILVQQLVLDAALAARKPKLCPATLSGL